MKWSAWLDTIRQEPQNIVGRLDQEIGLEVLDDEAEEQAITHALQSYDSRILFLEGERNDLLAYRLQDDWILRNVPEDVPRSSLSRILSYTLHVSDLLGWAERHSNYGDYYSLRPLVYGGDYWLNTVCRQEMNRFQEIDGDHQLGLIVIPWRRGWSLFELVESLRRGDRIGYFETLLGILLPFTNQAETRLVEDRLQEHFDVSETFSSYLGTDFNTVHELRNAVEKRL